ncbi:MAG: HAD family hydrolase [Fidelibacterota bacterium]
MKYDGFIFDIDGVLLDTSQSFTQAVLLAVKTATGSGLFNEKHIVQLKGIPGFNNDWDVAVAGAIWTGKSDGESFNDFIHKLEQYHGGTEALQSLAPSDYKIFKEPVPRLVMEAYGGTSACQTLYGFEPQTILVEGMWKNEISFVSPEMIYPYLPVSGIVSGRNRTEMELAFKILGWELPWERVAFSDIPAFNKPNPAYLVRIMNRMNCQYPVFLGDSRDDLELVKNYINQTGNPMDFCCVGIQHGIKEFSLRVNHISEFFNNVGQYHG